MISASGSQDRLAQPDLPVVDAAERDHRRAGALRAEAGEGLRVPALAERGDRQHFRGRHHALAAAAVNPDLEHPDPHSVLTAILASGGLADLR